MSTFVSVRPIGRAVGGTITCDYCDEPAKPAAFAITSQWVELGATAFWYACEEHAAPYQEQEAAQQEEGVPA